MIIIRDVFQLHFGKASEGVKLMKEGMGLLRQQGYGVTRLLTDVTGEYYTLVMESNYQDLAAFEKAQREATATEAWRALYARFVPLVRSGRREVFREVE